MFGKLFALDILRRLFIKPTWDALVVAFYTALIIITLVLGSGIIAFWLLYGWNHVAR